MNCGARDGVPRRLESVPEVERHLCRALARPATHSRDRHRARHAELGSRNSIALASDFSCHRAGALDPCLQGCFLAMTLDPAMPRTRPQSAPPWPCCPMLTGLSACTGATESAARAATTARSTAGMATMAAAANGAGAGLAGGRRDRRE